MKRTKRRLIAWTAVLLATLFAGFLASGVMLAQSTQEFDLGCRAELTAGGSWTQYSNANVTLHSSLGQPLAGRATVQGSGIIIQGGYMLNASGESFAAPAAEAQGAGGDTALDESAVALDGVYLPAVYAVNFIRFVRPCNWSWASATPSVD